MTEPTQTSQPAHDPAIEPPEAGGSAAAESPGVADAPAGGEAAEARQGEARPAGEAEELAAPESTPTEVLPTEPETDAAPEAAETGADNLPTEPEAEAAPPSVEAQADHLPTESESDAAPQAAETGADHLPTEAETDSAPAEATVTPAPAKADSAPASRKAAPKPRRPPRPVSPKVAGLQRAMDEGRTIEGKVIGWNKGGLHVVVDGITAFCPHSEMEIGAPRAPQGYLDKSFDFRVLKIQKRGKRIVLSRAADLKAERAERRAEIRQRVADGAVIKGRVASLTDFGAFVDLGGVQGLVHVSELSRRRVDDPRSVLQVGDEVTVKVLKVEQGGRRISLSMKALEPDPWEGVADRFAVGAVVKGTVDKTTNFGAFVLLEPGLTGLLPTSGMNLPRDAQPRRVFSPGKELSVQITGVDPRRRRISLALEGSQVEGSRADYEAFVRGQREGRSGAGFNALAAALQKVRSSTE